MTVWRAGIIYFDDKNKSRTTSIDMGNFSGADLGADALLAENAITQIYSAMDKLTVANKRSVQMSHQLFASNVLPASDTLITTHLQIVCYVSAPTEVPKTVTLTVPAPDASLFLADKKTLDISNPDVIDFVQQMSQHAFVSDGEKINTATGQNGIKSGKLVSAKGTY